jgi:GT2 family glycosyltransferase
MGTCAAGNKGRLWVLNEDFLDSIVVIANDHIVSDGWLQPLINMPADYGNPFVFMSMDFFTKLDSVVNVEMVNKYKDLRIKYLQEDIEENLTKVLKETYGDFDDFVSDYKKRHVDNLYIETKFKQWPGIVFYRKYILEKVGLEDEEFLKYTLAGGADVDYSIRIALAGFKCVVAMQSFAHHWGSISTRKMGLKSDGYRPGYVSKWPQAVEYLRNKWRDNEFAMSYLRQMNVI